MDYIQFFVFFGALCIGLTLGLIGGGGSILTVPVLVYLMGLDPHTATAYSLFVVGVSALVASVKNARKKMIDFRMGLVFAFPAFVVVFVMRKFVLPVIPEKILRLGDYTLLKPDAIMLFFAMVMLLASVSMIRGRKDGDDEKSLGYNYPVIFLQGMVVGCITGLVGAGGGFLIIPALVLLAKLPVKRAVATSLMIVAINSLCGFLGDVQTTEIDWGFLLLFTGVAVIGILVGSIFNSRIDSVKLRKLFGWFVLVMGIYIILKEFI
jgi:uncharacterized membrane protein YfcA